MTAYCASVETERKSFSHWGQIEVPAGTEYRYSMGHPHQDYGYDARYLHHGDLVVAMSRMLKPHSATWQHLDIGPGLD